MDENKNQSNPREHFANERTLLAWIRTSLSMMGFGLAGVKFSLFEAHSRITGIMLVAMGTISSILPYISYKRSEKQLNEGSFKNSSLLVTILSFFIFLISIFLLLYLTKII